MNKILVYTQLFFVIALISCEPKAIDNAKTPEFKQKIVAYCYLSANDSVNYAIVRYNVPEYGEITHEVFSNPGNKVVISDGVNEQELIMQCDTIVGYDNQKYLQEDTFFLDTKSFPIIEGKEYSLSVTDYKNNKVNAKCIIPIQREMNFQWDTVRYVKHQEYGDDIFLKVTVGFTDYANESNFYNIVCNTIAYYDTANSYGTIENIWKIFDVIKSDYLMDGKVIKSIIDVPADFFASNDIVFLKVSVLQTDKNYYEFYKSLQKYQFEENPFTEVTHLYSNITGGLGVFCGYTKQEIKIKLK